METGGGPTEKAGRDRHRANEEERVGKQNGRDGVPTPAHS